MICSSTIIVVILLLSSTMLQRTLKYIMRYTNNDKTNSNLVYRISIVSKNPDDVNNLTMYKYTFRNFIIECFDGHLLSPNCVEQNVILSFLVWLVLSGQDERFAISFLDQNANIKLHVEDNLMLSLPILEVRSAEHLLN